MRSRYWFAVFLLTACALSNGQALNQAIGELERSIAGVPGANPKDRAHKMRLSIDLSKLLIQADKRLDAIKILAPFVQGVSAANSEIGPAEAELFEVLARQYLDLEVD